MALKNKYQREKQQYSNDGGVTWYDVTPPVTRKGRLLETASEDCNTIQWREVEGAWFCVAVGNMERWVTVQNEYECVAHNKWTKEKKQLSSDGGTTWVDSSPLETRAGTLIEADSTDCGYEPLRIYRWVEVQNEYMCDGTTKYTKEKQQYSTDGGTTWTDVSPANYRSGNIIEYNSVDCGYISYTSQYLTFEALEDGYFHFSQNPIQYSLDNGSTWNTLAVGSSITVLTGDKVMWKANIQYGGLSDYGIGTFTSTGRFNVYGNVMSLLAGDNFQNATTILNYQFTSLFCISDVVSAENLVLPATTLTDECYYDMFGNCTSLTTPPLLPATTLAYKCYWRMFYGCTSLTTLPSILATTLSDYCCYEMFKGCTSLTTAQSLPSTRLSNHCYEEMFYGCTSLTTAPALPATILYDYCYKGMFEGCSSLTTAPALPATTLGARCYNSMFKGCSSLITAPSTLPATTLRSECYEYMFQSCTSLTTAPVLPALVLTDHCYYRMFYNCHSLNYIKAMFTVIQQYANDYCTKDWVYGVAANGTFVKNVNATWSKTGYDGIPSGWTVQTASS